MTTDDRQVPNTTRRARALRLLRAALLLFVIAGVLVVPVMLLRWGFWSKYVAMGAILSGGLGITCLLNGAWDYWSSR